MIDPITALSLATAAFNGIKKAVELGKEVQDVYSQLSQWAGHIDDLRDALSQIEKQEARPSIFKKITFEKSATAEAFDKYAAEQRIVEMEKEIFHMFIYGELQDLGIDGYRRFKQMREEIRQKRQKMILDQIRAKRDFVDSVKLWSAIGLALLVGITTIWITVDVILDHGVQSGKIKK
jgi:predicted  nucleic acid-binding Zn-ribbon protein